MQKALIALPWSPKSKIIKARNQFNVYVSNVTYNKKLQNKKNFAFILKESYFIFKVREVKRELDSTYFFVLSVLATKLFDIATSPRDISNLLFRSLVFGLL